MKINNCGKIIFTLYLIALTWIFLFKFSISFEAVLAQADSLKRSINLIPFTQTVVINGRMVFREMFFNLFIFVPFGGLIGVADKRSAFKRKAGYIALFSLGIEALQYIFALGATDITDLIMNTAGGVLGLLLYDLLAKKLLRTDWTRFYRQLAFFFLYS